MDSSVNLVLGLCVVVQVNTITVQLGRTIDSHGTLGTCVGALEGLQFEEVFDREVQ